MKDAIRRKIKNMIKNGFDINLISFELDIPLQQIKKIEQEVIEERENSFSKIQTKQIKHEKSKKIRSKMDILRRKYNAMYFKSNSSVIEEKQEQSEAEEKIISQVIKRIKFLVIELDGCSLKERRSGAISILKEVKKVLKYDLTIDQAESIFQVLDSNDLKNLNLNSRDTLDGSIKRTKIKIIENLMNSIKYEYERTNSLEQLRKLSSKITIDMQNTSHLLTSGPKLSIQNKILKIQQANISNKANSDIPHNIVKIAIDLASGKCNIENANRIIEIEIKRKLDNTKSFALNEEQARKQVVYQIQSVIEKQPEIVNIKNPEVTLKQIMDIEGAEFDKSINSIVNNLILRKDFETALDFCEQFSEFNGEGKLYGDTMPFVKKIKNAEIADFILKGINMNGTAEEENRYFELIKKGIDMGNTNINDIYLGRSQDGIRNIMLSDIWDNKSIEKYEEHEEYR